ncbi:DnaJ like subfamily C member 22, partial [Dissostichus eleginoides]
MSSVQSMRRFVCDRLTAAAQEILGAYEKKIEGYEAEIARQRRLLDAVLTPELKLHRTELPQRHVQKLEEDDEVLVIQPQHFDQGDGNQSGDSIQDDNNPYKCD